MIVRRATVADAALLAAHRAAVWHEVGDWDTDELEPQLPVWTTFIARCIANETYVAFVAERDGRAIGSGALLVQLSIPRPQFDSDRVGRVQSVYVEPEARMRGVARAIMAELIAYARANAMISLTLHPSDDGRALYASLGFTAADEMSLRLAPL